jgi:hypothetical protein
MDVTIITLPLTLQLTIELTDEQFFQLCPNNRDLRFERTKLGELIIMPPTGGETGRRNARITQRLLNWADTDGTGIAFDSSTCFKLPNVQSVLQMHLNTVRLRTRAGKINVVPERKDQECNSKNSHLSHLLWNQGQYSKP